MIRRAIGMLAASTALVLSACAASPPAAPPEPAPSDQPALFTLPPDGRIDYQLGGASPPVPGVTLVVRDATEPPAPGVASICYVNGFQTQPGELDAWLAEAPEAVLEQLSQRLTNKFLHAPTQALGQSDAGREEMHAVVRRLFGLHGE